MVASLMRVQCKQLFSDYGGTLCPQCPVNRYELDRAVIFSMIKTTMNVSHTNCLLVWGNRLSNELVI